LFIQLHLLKAAGFGTSSTLFLLLVMNNCFVIITY